MSQLDALLHERDVFRIIRCLAFGEVFNHRHQADHGLGGINNAGDIFADFTVLVFYFLQCVGIIFCKDCSYEWRSVDDGLAQRDHVGNEREQASTTGRNSTNDADHRRRDLAYDADDLPKTHGLMVHFVQRCLHLLLGSDNFFRDLHHRIVDVLSLLLSDVPGVICISDHIHRFLSVANEYLP